MLKKNGKHIILTATPTNVVPAVLNAKGACKDYKNCISGTFSWQNKLNSIFFAWNKEKNNLSAHAWAGYPDCVIWCDLNGKMHTDVLTSFDGETKKQVLWAVGGMGLLDYYNPSEQGYCKFTKYGKTYNYSDVLRKTNHTVLGYTQNGEVYGIYFNNLSAKQISKYCKKINLWSAVLLDGGHVAGCNTEIGSYNTATKQQNIIQFIQK